MLDYLISFLKFSQVLLKLPMVCFAGVLIVSILFSSVPVCYSQETATGMEGTEFSPEEQDQFQDQLDEEFSADTEDKVAKDKSIIIADELDESEQQTPLSPPIAEDLLPATGPGFFSWTNWHVAAGLFYESFNTVQTSESGDGLKPPPWTKFSVGADFYLKPKWTYHATLGSTFFRGGEEGAQRLIYSWRNDISYKLTPQISLLIGHSIMFNRYQFSSGNHGTIDLQNAGDQSAFFRSSRVATSRQVTADIGLRMFFHRSVAFQPRFITYGLFDSEKRDHALLVELVFLFSRQKQKKFNHQPVKLDDESELEASTDQELAEEGEQESEQDQLEEEDFE